ncbi:hypothetical protein E5675_07305 [Sphingopyxis sp. PAMC25046]|uniref:hypothetical protein n=1 Tax=Sphingopyxis sp. PAMC25046 TaxID=2565556 RepID=UPI00109DFF6E|nr:hypothetical protein [Sphingopyxis sp. PAMC25046]QCB54257.1 hypothetical protein E5675_07305 [Sphingopyxis sp. PAMC25046]
MARDAIDAVKKGGARDYDTHPISHADEPGRGAGRKLRHPAVMIAVLIALSTAPAGPPDASVIEYLLLRKEYCTVTVDGCSDHEGRQIRFNTRYAVSNVVCEEVDKSEQAPRSWRCGFDVRLTHWMEGEQVGEAQIDRRTEIFDLTRFTVHDGKREIPSILWTQRTREQAP